MSLFLESNTSKKCRIFEEYFLFFVLVTHNKWGMENSRRCKKFNSDYARLLRNLRGLKGFSGRKMSYLRVNSVIRVLQIITMNNKISKKRTKPKVSERSDVGNSPIICLFFCFSLISVALHKKCVH